MAIERGGMLLDETTGDFVGFKTPGSGKDVFVPRLSTDASGNVTGLVGPDGLALQSTLGALSKRKASMRFGGGPNGTGVATTALRMTQQLWRIPFPVYGFRLGIESNLAAATTFSLCKAAVLGTGSESITDAINLAGSMHSATPFNITWSGAAGATVPARTAADDPDGITWSDWTYQPMTAGQVLAMRMLWPDPGSAWAYPYAANAISVTDLLSAAPDLFAVHFHNTVDYVTAWNSWAVTTANASNNLSVQYIQFLTTRPTISVGVVGDSTTVGSVDSGTTALAPVWDACDQLSSDNLGFSPICRGWSGKEASANYTYALDLIDNYKPDILIYQAWSQNDAAPTTNTQEIALVLDIVSRCKAAGIVPILLTGIPLNTWSTPTHDASETARLAVNSAVRALGEVVCDVDSVLSDGASPANYSSVYGTGAHPNQAGYAAITAEYMRAIREALGLPQ